MMQARRRLGGLFLSTAIATTASSSSCLHRRANVAPVTTMAPTLVSTMQVTQRRFNASDAAASDSSSSGGTALDVAMKVNKLKRMHQSGQGQGKKEIEKMAWRELNTLSEQQIATAEGKAVALLLNSWAYFARFWEKGKDGPYEGLVDGQQ